MPKGKIKVVLEVEEERVPRLKKRYFAMMDQLANFTGCISKSDRVMFRKQAEAVMGRESMSDMTEESQVKVKIEELHQFAQQHFNYTFPPDDPGIFTFDNRTDSNEQLHDRAVDRSDRTASSA